MLVVTAYLILFIAIRALCSLIFPRREWSRQSTEFIWGTGSFLSEAAAQNSFGEEKHSGKSWMTMACPTQYFVCRRIFRQSDQEVALYPAWGHRISVAATAHFASTPMTQWQVLGR